MYFNIYFIESLFELGSVLLQMIFTNLISGCIDDRHSCSDFNLMKVIICKMFKIIFFFIIFRYCEEPLGLMLHNNAYYLRFLKFQLFLTVSRCKGEEGGLKGIIFTSLWGGYHLSLIHI